MRRGLPESMLAEVEMEQSMIGRVLWRAADDEEFRDRTMRSLGAALAEEGFILNDADMATLRTYWESLVGLNRRAVSEKIQAFARSYRD